MQVWDCTRDPLGSQWIPFPVIFLRRHKRMSLCVVNIRFFRYCIHQRQTCADSGRSTGGLKSAAISKICGELLWTALLIQHFSLSAKALYIQNFARTNAAILWDFSFASPFACSVGTANLWQYLAVKLSTVGSRAFPVVGPQIWNERPAGGYDVSWIAVYILPAAQISFLHKIIPCFLDVN